VQLQDLFATRVVLSKPLGMRGHGFDTCHPFIIGGLRWAGDSEETGVIPLARPCPPARP
jgi:hypothetical protein